MTDNPPVAPGDEVYDLGCGLMQELRANGHAPPAERARVLRVFSWGLRLGNALEEWDCEHWTAVTDD